MLKTLFSIQKLPAQINKQNINVPRFMTQLSPLRLDLLLPLRRPLPAVLDIQTKGKVGQLQIQN
jgi:hypothetical protein